MSTDRCLAGRTADTMFSVWHSGRIILLHKRWMMGLLCLCATSSLGRCETIGNAELLRDLVAMRKDNNGKVLTWQGRVNVESQTTYPQMNVIAKTEEVAFTLDMAKESLLWITDVTKAHKTQDGALEDVQEAIGRSSGLRMPQGLYELSPLFTNKESKASVNGLVIWPSAGADKRLRMMQCFDPRTYLFTWEGQDVDELLETTYKCSQNPEYKGKISIEKEIL